MAKIELSEKEKADILNNDELKLMVEYFRINGRDAGFWLTNVLRKDREVGYFAAISKFNPEDY